MRCLALPVFVVSGLVSAQDPTPLAAIEARLLPEVTARLGAADPAEVAWGGYLVQHLRLGDAGPALRQALVRWRSQTGWKARLVHLHLADALLQNGIDVPFAEIDFLLQDRLTRVPALLLLAQDVEAHAADLAAVAMAQPWDRVSEAAVRLLLQRRAKAPGLAAWLLPFVDFRCTIHVRGGGEPDLGPALGGGWGNRPGAPRTIVPPPGFPQLVRYELGQTHEVSNDTGRIVCVADGEQEPLLVQVRTEAARMPREMQEHLQPGGRPWSGKAERWLARMAGVPLPKVGVDLTFTDAAQLRAAVARARDEMRPQLAQLLAKLRRGGWLRADELADFKIPFRTDVVDGRGDTSVPLPAFEEVSR